MKTFNEITEAVLGVPAAQIRDNMTPKDIPNWDSMNYLLFIAELEKEFGVSFGMNEVLSADSLGAIKTMLRAKGVHV